MNETKSTTVVNRLLDPFSIYSILTIINSILMLILYFVLPVVRSFNYETEIFTYYYWNGYFRDIDYSTGNLVSTGIDETFPHFAHTILLISIIMLLALAILQVVIVLVNKKMTKRKFLSYFIVPNFICNSLLLFGVFSFVHWIDYKAKSTIDFNLEIPLIYILLVGILVTFLIVGFATTLTMITKRKEKKTLLTF